MEGTVPSWVAIVGPLAGFAAAIGTEAFRDWRTVRRDREAREEGRRIAREDARDAFERDTLLALEDASFRVVAEAMRVYRARVAEFHRSGQWGRDNLAGGTDGEPPAALVREVERFGPRALDDTVRELAKKLSEAAVLVVAPSADPAVVKDPATAATVAIVDAIRVSSKLGALIGERLRALYSRP